MSAAAPVDTGSSRRASRRGRGVVVGMSGGGPTLDPGAPTVDRAAPPVGGASSLDLGAPTVPDRSPSLFARPLLLAVRGYQLARAGRPSPCRFDPSCSAYAVDALRRHGAARGSYLAVRRLARCHPWGGQGYDPVPEKKAHRCSS